jgi:hypothetical protein
MAPRGSPLVALAKQGAEAVNFIIAQRSAGNPRGEHFVGNQSNDRAKRARSEAAASVSGNHCLADNDVRWRITQNRQMREYDSDRDDLCNVINDRMHLRVRSLTPPRRSLARDVTPSGRGGFHALAPPLKQVIWPEKFKARHIDKYDGSSNSKEFIQVYHTDIEVTGGDDWVKINYLPTMLSSVARSWLINLPEGCCHPQHRWPRNPIRVNTVGPIPPPLMRRWERSI